MQKFKKLLSNVYVSFVFMVLCYGLISVILGVLFGLILNINSEKTLLDNIVYSSGYMFLLFGMVGVCHALFTLVVYHANGRIEYDVPFGFGAVIWYGSFAVWKILKTIIAIHLSDVGFLIIALLITTYFAYRIFDKNFKIERY